MDILRSPVGQLSKMVLLLLMVFAPPNTAIAQVTSSTVLGTVQDQSVSPIAGANVTATNLRTGLSRSVVSGSASVRLYFSKLTARRAWTLFCKWGT